MKDPRPNLIRRPPATSDIEAVDWLVRFIEIAHSQNANAERKEIQDEFNRWATRSPANLRSFLQTASMFEALGACEADIIPELLNGVETGQAAPSAALSGSLARVDMPAKTSWRNTGLPVAAVMIGLLFLGVLLLRSGGLKVYHTPIGVAQRVIPLPDGSLAFLREDSELRVSFSKTRRDITLVYGEAFLDVAPDPRRRLHVYTHNSEIRDMGTRFDVSQRDGRTRVAVLEGSVHLSLRSNSAVAEPQPNADQVTLDAGEVGQADDRTVRKLDGMNARQFVGWHSTELLVNHEPLSKVIAQFNRDNRRHLRIVDSAIADRRIIGTFKTDEPEALLQNVRKMYPDLSVRDTGDEWIIETQYEASAK